MAGCLYRLADAIARRAGVGELKQVELFQGLWPKAAQQLAAQAPTPHHLSPQPFIRIELVDEALVSPLFERQIVIRIHVTCVFIREKQIRQLNSNPPALPLASELIFE